MEGKAEFGSDHAGRALGMTRGSFTRRQGRKHLLGRCTTLQWTAGLDVARRGFEASGAFVQVTVDTDVTKFPALEAGFVIVEVVMGEGCIMVAASPLDFSVGDCSFFFFGQGRR